jgi:hypothetical protein
MSCFGCWLDGVDVGGKVEGRAWRARGASLPFYVAVGTPQFLLAEEASAVSSHGLGGPTTARARRRRSLPWVGLTPASLLQIQQINWEQATILPRVVAQLIAFVFHIRKGVTFGIDTHAQEPRQQLMNKTMGAF